MPARIDSITGDEILYVVDRTRDGGAQLAVQTDEAKATYFDLTPGDVAALVRDLVGAKAPANPATATGCEHSMCYDVGPESWQGCVFIDQGLDRYDPTAL